MDAKKFKVLFGQTAEIFGFTSAFGGAFKHLTDCVVVLVLQKSNFGDYFELNVKFFFNGLFGKNISIDKALIVKESGHVFLRPPKKYNSLFNISEESKEVEISKKMSGFFDEFLVPIVAKASSRSGILKLASEGEVFILPAVKVELEKIRTPQANQ